MTTNITLAIIAALCGLIAAGAGATFAYKWFISGTDIRRSRNISIVALALTVLTGIGAIAPWPAAAPLGETTNADNPGLNITVDEPEVPMNGYRTNAQLDEFLREGFGDDYDAIWNGNTADEFMFAQDQDKILANEAYLQSLGLDETGFRNGVAFPTDILTAEVIKNLPSMTDEERAEVYNQHRWLDVYRRLVTNPGFCDMVVQDLDYYPEFIEQNERWLPAFKELLAEAKASEDGIYSLLIKEADGTEHYSDAYRYGAAKVCTVLENAIIRGVAMDPESIVNWELPSMSPDIQERWTVKLTELEDQENKPASIWAFPNTKSGQDAYTDGFNLADMRAEKFEPEKTVPKVNTPDTSTPPGEDPPPSQTPTHTVYTYYRVLGTDNNIVPRTTQTVAEGETWTSSKKNLEGYTYNSNNFKTTNGVVTDIMGTSDVTVIFYYTKNNNTPETEYANLTVQHVDAYTGKVLEQEGPLSYVKGTEQSVAKKSFSDYVYAGYFTINSGSKTYAPSTTVTLDGDKTVVFYYDYEYELTTKHVDLDTGKEFTDYRAYDYYVGGSTFTAYSRDIAGYERVGNSENNSNPSTVSGTMPHADKTVTFYYRKVAQTYTVTAYYRAIDSNHNLIDPVVQTVQAGQPYSTDQKSFPGYRFRYTTGDATSGTMPTRNVTVTYWYELIEQDGNNNKRPESDPTQNGTGNANPPKGPDDTTELETWQPEDPDTGERVPEQTGDEYSSNQNQDKTPGAGSDERQEVSNTPVGATDEKTDGMSSGTGGQDHPVTGDNVQNGTPTDKTDPDPVVDTDWSQDNGGNQTDTILPPP